MLLLFIAHQASHAVNLKIFCLILKRLKTKLNNLSHRLQ